MANLRTSPAKSLEATPADVRKAKAGQKSYFRRLNPKMRAFYGKPENRQWDLDQRTGWEVNARLGMRRVNKVRKDLGMTWKQWLAN